LALKVRIITRLREWRHELGSWRRNN